MHKNSQAAIDETSYTIPGSSNGRGPRCAAWFLQYVREVAGDENMQVMTLEGQSLTLSSCIPRCSTCDHRGDQRLGQGRTSVHEAHGRIRREALATAFRRRGKESCRRQPGGEPDASGRWRRRCIAMINDSTDEVLPSAHEHISTRNRDRYIYADNTKPLCVSLSSHHTQSINIAKIQVFAVSHVAKCSGVQVSSFQASWHFTLDPIPLLVFSAQ